MNSTSARALEITRPLSVVVCAYTEERLESVTALAQAVLAQAETGDELILVSTTINICWIDLRGSSVIARR